MGAGYYERRVFPWLNDRLAAEPALQALRADTLATASGRVIEIGFGSGANLPHYPEAVQAVTGVEPNPRMTARARVRIRAARVPVHVIEGQAEQLPFPAAQFETAVSTLTLCSVTDPPAVLAELRRVLVPGGRLIVLEHGLAEDPGVARWQQRFDGLQGIVGCGCSLVRPVPALLEQAGFRFVTLRNFFAPKVPRTHGWISAGVAISV